MTEAEVAQAVADWIDALIPAITVTRPFVSAQKTTLPDASVEVLEKRTALNDPYFPYSQLQQTMMRLFDVQVVFMVEKNTGLDADRDETAELRGYGAVTEAAALEDASLGGRVQMVSPQLRFNYETPFVEYQDGVRGRQMEARLTVGEVMPDQS